MDVPQIEERLTELVEKDIKNPEIYGLLKQLAAIYIYQNKFVYGYSDIDSVCHDVAADTYMRVLKGRTSITKWMYYVGKSIQLSYVRNQRKIEHEIIETTYKDSKIPTVSQDAVIAMSAGSAYSIGNEFNRVTKITFLRNIDNMIREVMSHNKFKQGTKEWLSLYTSVCLSLYHDRIIYFRMANAMKPFVRLVILQFKETLKNSDFLYNEFMDSQNELPTLVFYDEQAYREDSKRRDV